MKKCRELGEREIIKIIQSQLDIMPGMPVPFGDDVSACNLGHGRVAVLKTDMLVGLTDVPQRMNLWQAARKAVVMNVSDFAAKSVKPVAVLVSLGLPKGLRKSAIVQIGRGLNAGAREYGAYVVGGDTGETSDLVISLSVFGTAREGEMALRSGAKPGDIVAVTGFFGKTAAGLRILTHKARASLHTRGMLVESVLMPQARLKEGLALSHAKAVTAAIDSSDGLAWSLHEIAGASHVGMTLDRLPVAEEAQEFARTNKLDATELALYGGEEYELVLTLKADCWKKAVDAVEQADAMLLPIGKVTTSRRILLKVGTKQILVEHRGYEHFINDS